MIPLNYLEGRVDKQANQHMRRTAGRIHFSCHSSIFVQIDGAVTLHAFLYVDCDILV